ncbi:class F sortase [Nonomuraea sp. ATR24]|uniref:class F sortase n=1 Tax=Nonomuraea TaxID=83681 RepID=UPI001FEA0E18|nr:class F sortase [Nonomuraea ceibae]
MPERGPGGRTWVVAWAVLAVLLVGTGLFLVLSPRPGPPSAMPQHPAATSAGAPPAAALPRSVPTRLRVPAIGVDAQVVAMGLNPDGTAGEPPLSRPDLVSWFSDGAAPGQIGVSAFYGHVDSRRSGPAVFYRVAQLTPGAAVQVSRRDGRTATFEIYAVERYAKTDFPTDRVYAHTGRSEIRLITCGGTFDPAKGSYRDNIVAFGSLVTPRP